MTLSVFTLRERPHKEAVFVANTQPLLTVAFFPTNDQRSQTSPNLLSAHCDAFGTLTPRIEIPGVKMRTLKTVVAGGLLPIGMVLTLGVGVATAKSATFTPVSLVGPVTCSVTGTVSFSPPLQTGGTVPSTVTVRASLHKCTDTRAQGAKLTTGHVSGLTGTTTTNDCATLLSGGVPDLSSGNANWSPTSKIVASSGISLTGGSATVVTGGKKSTVQLSFSGGSVTSGSFAGESPSVTVSSKQDTTQLNSRCVNGLSELGFKGSATI
jgi:hypothetical protein